MLVIFTKDTRLSKRSYGLNNSKRISFRKQIITGPQESILVNCHIVEGQEIKILINHKEDSSCNESEKKMKKQAKYGDN